MACLRLFTVLPLLPDLRVPFLRRRIALSTRFDAALPYLLRPDDFLAATGSPSRNGMNICPRNSIGACCARESVAGEFSVRRPASDSSSRSWSHSSRSQTFSQRHDQSNRSRSRSHQSTHRRRTAGRDAGNSCAMSDGRTRPVDGDFENAYQRRWCNRSRGDRLCHAPCGDCFACQRSTRSGQSRRAHADIR